MSDVRKNLPWVSTAGTQAAGGPEPFTRLSMNYFDFWSRAQESPLRISRKLFNQCGIICG